MLQNDLATWLNHIRTLHHSIIDYSLHRIKEVAARLDLLKPDTPVIMITGTNGKGSTVATMEAILLASEHQVGSFTSPYLQSFNEQIRLNGTTVSDTDLIQAFEMIETARGEISLSEFEFTTLAALIIFKAAPLDIILFEVGLGGGNDATNIINADVTVVTSIALDHEAYLGETLELIAESEAQLLRPYKLGIIGVKHPPQTLLNHAQQIACPLKFIEQDFHFEETTQSWHFYNNQVDYADLPKPIILCKNAALAIQALLAAKIKFTEAQLKKGLKQIQIQGRLQFIKGSPLVLIDVAHNVEAVTQLAKTLAAHQGKSGKTIALFSMFQDKDIDRVVKMMAPLIDQWFIAPIDHARAASFKQLSDAFVKANIANEFVSMHPSLFDAHINAQAAAKERDLLVLFGSFHVARLGLN